jgi:murein hydrolase activator
MSLLPLVFLQGLLLFAYGSPVNPEAAKEQNLQRLQQELSRMEKVVQSGKATEASLSGELERLEKLLRLQALEIQFSSNEFEKTELSFQEISMRQQSLQGSIQQRKDRLRHLLSVLPVLETKLPLVRITQDDHEVLAQYRELIGRLLKQDRMEILTLRNLLAEVGAVNKTLGEERERMLAHREDLEEKKAVLELNQKMKLDLLRRTRTEQSQRLKAYNSAKAAEAELESMLGRLRKRSLEPQTVAGSAVSGGRDATESSFGDKNFATRKGSLNLPVSGDLITAFGRKYDPKTSLYTFHKGVDIQTSRGGDVRAIHAGRVVFAGRLGGYGQLLILDHGDQYYSLVGQLGEMLRKENDLVRAGEVIGRSAPDGTPVYFEIRQRHVALNPLPWLAADQRRLSLRDPQ